MDSNNVNNEKKRYYIFSLDMKILNIFSFVILILIGGLTFVMDQDFLMSAINYTFAIERLFFTFILLFLYLSIKKDILKYFKISISYNYLLKKTLHSH